MVSTHLTVWRPYWELPNTEIKIRCLFHPRSLLFSFRGRPAGCVQLGISIGAGLASPIHVRLPWQTSVAPLDHFDGNFSVRSQGRHQTCPAVLDASLDANRCLLTTGRVDVQFAGIKKPQRHIAIANALHDALWLCKQHRLQLWVGCMHGIDRDQRVYRPVCFFHSSYTVVSHTHVCTYVTEQNNYNGKVPDVTLSWFIHLGGIILGLHQMHTNNVLLCHLEVSPLNP
jgi:hypothetical protein